MNYTRQILRLLAMLSLFAAPQLGQAAERAIIPFPEELMAMSPYEHPKVSNFTLALLDDLGWYHVDYGARLRGSENALQIRRHHQG